MKLKYKVAKNSNGELDHHAMTEEPTSYIRPEYRRTSAGHKPIDGVQFYSYRTGISRYARISEDGQIMTRANARDSGYNAYVIGHGPVIAANGVAARRFQSQDAAALAAIQIWRKGWRC
jgi:hypothetical protein